MIFGHGDDIYKYGNIRLNFSSNIPSFVDISPLEEYLRSRLSVIRSYPEPSPRTLEGRSAESIGRNADEVLVTSGATEAIYLIAQAAPLLSPHKGGEIPSYTIIHPTFSEYDSACQMFGFNPVPSREGKGGFLCWLCNPNNPTGEIYEEAYLRELAQRHRWLVIDQSYEDHTLSSVPNVESLPNVITLHSMTKKFCIPGLRLGYITASTSVIDKLRKQCRPWAVNALAIEAGLWLIEHQPHWVDVPSYLAEAQRLRTMLNAIPSIQVQETQTNFMLCTIEHHTAADLKEYLAAQHGILIRDASNFRGLTSHHFRVAAQRPEDNDELADSIRQLRTHPQPLSFSEGSNMGMNHEKSAIKKNVITPRPIRERQGEGPEL